MGYYVNPVDQTKEDWLAANGVRLAGAPDCDALEALVVSGFLPVCYVQNPMFSAAAVCYTATELLEFTRPTDTRPKAWFKVSVDALVQVNALPDNWRELEQCSKERKGVA